MPFRSHRTIWINPASPEKICIIDQRYLPHEVRVAELTKPSDVYNAIRDMLVRGAPLIGVTASYGMYLVTLEAKTDEEIRTAADFLISARPTAVNLKWAVEEQLKAIMSVSGQEERKRAAFETACRIEAEDISMCLGIAEHGVKLIQNIHQRTRQPVNILTHCNAGRLACVEWGTATAPIYRAHELGIPVHVWVDETRPRNQGASLTAWELHERGVPCTLITDNAGGLLMRRKKVDIVLVGTDRTSRNGDVANKIGTYLKALAAKANQVPFYVALPSPSIDWEIHSGSEIPIEERSEDEVKYVSGMEDGVMRRVLIAPEGVRVSNYGFDVTPAELVTGLITERGIAHSSEEGLLKLFPEKNKSADAPRDEGVIKFECRWVSKPPLSHQDLTELIECRQRLYEKSLIGVYPDGIGFGNLSLRKSWSTQFIISGSQTSLIEEVGDAHFTLVKHYDIRTNHIDCEGPVKASSESLTHAMIYESFLQAEAVIHVHHPEAWKRLQGTVPTTSKSVPYGTPEMAAEIRRLAETSELKEKKILVMAGHEDGIIAFGVNLKEAEEILLKHVF